MGLNPSLGLLEKKNPLHLPGLEIRFAHSVDLSPYRHALSDPMSVAYPSTRYVQNPPSKIHHILIHPYDNFFGARGGAVG
jgi:hypothetical protein